MAASLALLFKFVLDWFYGGFFETFLNGQTPGKMACSLRVLTDRDQPINGLQAVLRNLIRTADYFGVGLIFIILLILVLTGRV